MEFPYLLASYGASNLAVQRDRTIDLYLRSKNSTFDRYAAAKEVRAGLSELQKEAVAEIQTMAPQGAAKMFYVVTDVPVGTYSAQLGGFPLFDPFSQGGSFRYPNPELTRSGLRNWGAIDGHVHLSLMGWVIPATADEASQTLQRLSQTQGARKATAAITYTLGRCDAVTRDTTDTSLVCEGTIHNVYVYSSADAASRLEQPVVTGVKR
jgi:hypothetical protein